MRIGNELSTSVIYALYTDVISLKKPGSLPRNHFLLMAPKKKKEYSDDLREVVIKHFLNGDSEREIARKVSIPRSCIDVYD